MEPRNLETYGEPGAIVYRVDCVELMRLVPAGSVDAIFADPPYRLSGGGVTVKSGRLSPVDKGDWDRSMGFSTHYSAYSCSSQHVVGEVRTPASRRALARHTTRRGYAGFWIRLSENLPL